MDAPHRWGMDRGRVEGRAARAIVVACALALLVGGGCGLQTAGEGPSNDTPDTVLDIDGIHPPDDADVPDLPDAPRDDALDAPEDADVPDTDEGGADADDEEGTDVGEDADDGADDGACGAGLVRCGTECVSIESDPRHCGGCGRPCSGAAHATPACVSRSCSLSCDSGWGDCDLNPFTGCETDVTLDARNCRACGNVCPAVAGALAACTGGTCGFTCVANLGDCDGNPANGCEAVLLNDARNCNGCGLECLGTLNSTPLCSGATCSWVCNAGFVPLAGRCAVFGGAWELDDCGRCVDPNPYTTGCNCPPGFTLVAMRIVNDCPGSGGYSWATVAFCTSPVYPGGSDWAGVYQKNDPSAGGACVMPNLYTGACTCPAGTAAISLRAEVAGFNGTTIGLCYNSTAPITTFGGAYEVGDFGWVCLVGNPRAAGCSCPAGTSPFALRGVFYHGSPAGDWGTQMWICKP